MKKCKYISGDLINGGFIVGEFYDYSITLSKSKKTKYYKVYLNGEYRYGNNEKEFLLHFIDLKTWREFIADEIWKTLD